MQTSDKEYVLNLLISLIIGGAVAVRVSYFLGVAWGCSYFVLFFFNYFLLINAWGLCWWVQNKVVLHAWKLKVLCHKLCETTLYVHRIYLSGLWPFQSSQFFVVVAQLLRWVPTELKDATENNVFLAAAFLILRCGVWAFF